VRLGGSLLAGLDAFPLRGERGGREGRLAHPPCSPIGRLAGRLIKPECTRGSVASRLRLTG
jgi:hypothetical protein